MDSVSENLQHYIGECSKENTEAEYMANGNVQHATQ